MTGVQTCALPISLEKGIIKKSGSWFSYNDEKIGQGKENVKDTIEKNSELYNEIMSKVKGETPIEEE